MKIIRNEDEKDKQKFVKKNQWITGLLFKAEEYLF